MGRVSKTILVTQKLMAVSAQYEVVPDGAGAPTHAVKGDFMTTTPSLQLFDAKDNKLVASLKGNVLKTKFQIRDEKNDELASLNFSAVAFRKTFTMTVALIVSKEPGIRDKFKVELKEERDVPFEVAVLAAVALHSRFYE
jgi:uncharacterized protein YxjI